MWGGELRGQQAEHGGQQAEDTTAGPRVRQAAAWDCWARATAGTRLLGACASGHPCAWACCPASLPHAPRMCTVHSLPSSPQVRASGLVVNSMGWIVELGYELLKHTVQVGAGGVSVPDGTGRVHAEPGQLTVGMRRSAAQTDRAGSAAPLLPTCLPEPRAPPLPCHRGAPRRPSSAAWCCVVGDERLYSQLSSELRRTDPGIQVRPGQPSTEAWSSHLTARVAPPLPASHTPTPPTPPTPPHPHPPAGAQAAAVGRRGGAQPRAAAGGRARCGQKSTFTATARCVRACACGGGGGRGWGGGCRESGGHQQSWVWLEALQGQAAWQGWADTDPRRPPPPGPPLALPRS